MNLAEFKKLILKAGFNSSSNRNKGYVSLADDNEIIPDYAAGFISKTYGFYFFRINFNTIAYKANSFEKQYEWAIESNINDESAFDRFVNTVLCLIDENHSKKIDDYQQNQNQ